MNAGGDRLFSMTSESRVTIHMAASLDGFIARRDGAVDWLETSDEFVDGETLDPEYVKEFLSTIDCYVMGSKTYETALNFEAQGFGWAYGDTPTIILTTRDLPKNRESVGFYNGELATLINEQLRLKYSNIWIAGGGEVARECMRLGLADEIRYSVLPILIGDGIPFFGALERDVPLHLAEVRAYKNGIVGLCYHVRND